MRKDRCGDPDCVDFPIVHYCPYIVRCENSGIERLHAIELFLVQIAAYQHIAVGKLIVVTNKVGSPIAATNNAHGNHYPLL